VAGCSVWANDLNPESHRWLNENVRLNKVADRVRTFNDDGRRFLRTQLRAFLLSAAPRRAVHVTMNLPALAVEFLDAFPGLLADAEPNAEPNAEPDGKPDTKPDFKPDAEPTAEQPDDATSTVKPWANGFSKG